MADLLLDVADAIVDAINAHDWGQPVRAERSYADIDAPLEQLDSLVCDVLVPQEIDGLELDSSGSDKTTATYEIALRKRMVAAERDQTAGNWRREDVDRLVNLALDISRYFNADRFSGIEAAWIDTQVPQIYSRQELRELGQFTAVIELTYELHRTLP